MKSYIQLVQEANDRNTLEYNYDKYSLVFTLPREGTEHQFAVNDAVFDEANQILYTGSRDSTIRKWNITSV